MAAIEHEAGANDEQWAKCTLIGSSGDTGKLSNTRLLQKLTLLEHGANQPTP